MHISVKTVSAVSQNICKSFMLLPISTQYCFATSNNKAASSQ